MVVLPRLDVEEIERTLSLLVDPGNVFEIRALEAKFGSDWRTGTYTGFFNNTQACLTALRGIKEASAIYLTLNRVNPDLLARANNRMKTAGKSSTTADLDILRYHWLFIDGDPKRPSGISSTDKEHSLALEFTAFLACELKKAGWPDPIQCDSGNGAHLLYKIDLPTSDKSLLERVLKGLATKYDRQTITIDQTVFNPARICKLYGTLVCKGDSTPERPHRLSRLVLVPSILEVVPRNLLEAIAALEQEQSPVRLQSVTGLGLKTPEEFLRKYRISYRETKPGVYILVNGCVFNSEHTGQDAAVIVKPDGTWCYKCFHASCQEKGWREFRQVFEPDAYSRQSKPTKNEQANQSGDEQFDALRSALESKDINQFWDVVPVLAALDTKGQESWIRQIAKVFGKEVPISRVRQEIRKAGTNQDDKPSALELLTEIADRAKLLITPSGDMFARVPVNDHKETVSINEKGSGFRRWLIYCFDKEHGYVPNSEAMTQIMERIKSKTEYEGEQVRIHTRIAEKNGRVYLDMCNDLWECIEISSAGWKVIVDPPVYFRRSNGMLPLPVPQRNGTLDDLRSIINVKTERDFVLIASWLLGTLHPNGPYAVLNLNGERGSGKTRAETYLRNIIDPNEAPTRNAPRDERDAAILAKNNMIIALDNVSSIPLWLSDVLCRTATGSGFSTRALYEDELEKIFNSKRPIILNGIEDGIISQGDLLSRTIMVTLEPPDSYIAEEAIDQLFQELHPKILGALLQATSMALRDRKRVKLETPPRMVDFAQWVTAAEPALSWESGTFMNAFTENQESSATIITETSPVAKAMQQFLETRNSHQFVGLMSELLTELQKYEVYSKAKHAPSTASKLGGQIKRLAPVLRSQGIAIHQARSNQGSTIAISYVGSVGKSGESVGKNDAGVGKNPVSTPFVMTPVEMIPIEETRNSVGCVGKIPISSIPFHRDQEEVKEEREQSLGIADKPCNLPTLTTQTTQISEDEQIWKRRIQAYATANGYPQASLSNGHIIPRGQGAWMEFLDFTSQQWEQAYSDIRDRIIQKV